MTSMRVRMSLCRRAGVSACRRVGVKQYKVATSTPIRPYADTFSSHSIHTRTSTLLRLHLQTLPLALTLHTQYAESWGCIGWRRTFVCLLCPRRNAWARQIHGAGSGAAAVLRSVSFQDTDKGDAGGSGLARWRCSDSRAIESAYPYKLSGTG
jgi:hypothetical protein